MVSNPIIYNLAPSTTAKYNIKHRYLAHELRNVPHSKQTELTDTYSIGYMFKYIGYHQNFEFLRDTGRKMKDIDSSRRMKLATAAEMFNNFLKQFAFR